MITDVQLEILSASHLFEGMHPREILDFLDAAGAFPRSFGQGACLITQGEAQTDICILLSGAARGERLDSGGRVATVNAFKTGDVFGDVLSGAAENSPVSVRMTDGGEVIAIPFAALLRGTDALAKVREHVLRNLINEIAEKYFALLKRTEMLVIPTLRGKIAAYLLNESKNKKNTFESPHSREEQARLLGCDRSALSRELSRLRRENVIDFHGRRFTIIDLKKLEMLAQ